MVENINLNVNDALKFDFVLKVGNVSQTVSVDASAVQVDTTTTSMGTTITSSQILAMPLNGAFVSRSARASARCCSLKHGEHL